MALLEDLRRRVLVAAKKLREYDLIVMAGGTVGAFDIESGLMVITPSGMEYDDLTWEDMVVVDRDLKKVDGKRKQSVCSDMYMKIFKARPDIRGICHSHSRYATAFSCCNMEIPVITTTQGNLVGGPVPCTSFVHPDPHNDAYLDDIVDVIGKKGFACNIRNHGPIVCGRTVEEAIENIITVEVTAETTFIATRLGQPYILSEDETHRAFVHCKAAVGQG